MNQQEKEKLFDTSVSPLSALYHLRDEVYKTNLLIGQDPTLMSSSELQDLSKVYHKLLVDEFKEFAYAISHESPENVVKEAIDVLVVGTFLCKIHNGANMQFDYPDTFSADSASEIIRRLFHFRAEERYQTGYLIRQTSVVSKIFAFMNIDHMAAVNEVIKSNLSKFPLTSEIDINTEIEQLENGGRYSGVVCEPVIDADGNERAVFWSTYEHDEPKRKYLKPSTYVAADMSKVIK